jgi:hypothetical protein
MSDEQLSALAESDWALFKKWCREHRLAPLIKHTDGYRRANNPEFIKFVDRSTNRQSMRQLQVQRELAFLDRVLRDHGIAYVILKGPVLAFTCYPRPELRPMRDIDILVPKSKALDVFDLLLASGCSRIESSNESPESKLDAYKHLPAILGVSGKVSIEVHTRVFNQKEIGDAEDFSVRQDFWDCAIESRIANKQIVLENPTYLLAHLIFHAVYEHQLNNGPLVLTDIYHLLKSHSIDWDKFEGLVSDLNMEKGVQILFALVNKYYPQNQMLPDQYNLSDQDILAASEILFFADFSTRASRSVIRRSSAHQSKLVWLISAMFPSKQRIAEIYDISTASPLIHLCYVRNWLRLLFVLAPSHIASVSSGDRLLRAEANSAKKLGLWLEPPSD